MATVLSREISVVGVARMIWLAAPVSMRFGSRARAAEKKFSPGMNRATDAGVGWNWVH